MTAPPYLLNWMCGGTLRSVVQKFRKRCHIIIRHGHICRLNFLCLHFGNALPVGSVIGAVIDHGCLFPVFIDGVVAKPQKFVKRSVHVIGIDAVSVASGGFVVGFSKNRPVIEGLEILEADPGRIPCGGVNILTICQYCPVSR